MGHVIDLTGQRFGRLIAVSIGSDRRHWTCLCDCGRSVNVRSDCLKSGNSRSCGCLKRDSATKHGHSHKNAATPPTRTYTSWQAMWTRCTKESSDNFKYYGANGITVCERWKDFGAFLCDMGERPAGTSIDRIDNSRGYKPGNCRWATPKQQALNRRSNRHLNRQSSTEKAQHPT